MLPETDNRNETKDTFCLKMWIEQFAGGGPITEI